MGNIYVSIVTNEWHTPKKLVTSLDTNTVWYNPKGIANILYLGLVQKNHLVAYNSQDGHEFLIHSPHWSTFKTTKAGLIYHDMRHLLKNKDTHIMMNDSHYPIPQVKYKKKGYTNRDIKRADRARQFHHITGHMIKWILNSVDNNILENLPILR